MKWVQHRGVTKAPKFWKPGDVSRPRRGRAGPRLRPRAAEGPARSSTRTCPPPRRPSRRRPTRTTRRRGDESGGQALALARPARRRAFFAAAFGAGATPTRRSTPESTGDPVRPEIRDRLGDGPDNSSSSATITSATAPTAQDWRRIDGDWAAGAAAFALQLDSDTNNTSLALAFELPGGRVLLFPGDAQVGNWESWHADSDGQAARLEDDDRPRGHGRGAAEPRRAVQGRPPRQPQRHPPREGPGDDDPTRTSRRWSPSTPTSPT